MLYFAMMFVLCLITTPKNYSFNKSAFVDAATNGTLTLNKLKLYKSKGVDIHASNDYAIQQACLERQYTAVKLIVDHEGCPHLDDCLGAAARGGDIRIIRLFLGLGANPNAKCGPYKDSYILWEAIAGENHDAVAFLLENGAELHAHDNAITPTSHNQETLLAYATAHGDHKTVKVLLDWSLRPDVDCFSQEMINEILETAIEANNEVIQETIHEIGCWRFCFFPCSYCYAVRSRMDTQKAMRYLKDYLQNLAIRDL